jgi:HD-like signal output (HDOD) protein
MLDHDVVVGAAMDLEPLSPTAARLAALVAREDVGAGEIERAVTLDPALTGRLLRVANSATQGRRTAVGTVRAAVLHLGIGRVFSLAMAGSVRSRAQRALPEFGLSEGALWSHLVAAALAVEVLPRVIRVPVPPETFTAALLHDVGKVLMARFLDAEILAFLAAARAVGPEEGVRAEREVLGLHHGEVSALIAQAWRLPERLVHGIAYHGFPDEAEDLLCDLVHVADVAATRIGMAAGSAPRDVAVQPGPAGRLGLTEPAFEQLLSQLEERFTEVAAHYLG